MSGKCTHEVEITGVNDGSKSILDGSQGSKAKCQRLAKKENGAAEAWGRPVRYAAVPVKG